ncbi:MAG TPA: NAD(P)-binding domain-containing protein, partial [Paenirhodobacter sp.]
MKVAFIGLDGPGGPMATNLAEAGHQVTGYDPDVEMPEGVTAAPGAVAAVEGADVVITLLADAQALRITAAAVMAQMRKGAVFCDCSTVDVATARALADEA